MKWRLLGDTGAFALGEELEGLQSEMTDEKLLKRTHHDKPKLPHQLTAKQRGERAHAYGLRYQAWLRKMKELHPEARPYFTKKSKRRYR